MAQDPGMQYVYRPKGPPDGQRPPARPQPGRKPDPNTAHQQQEAALTMQHLPRDPLAARPSDPLDWSAALGNMHNARLAMEAVQGLVADAVFLDDEAFSSASTLQQYANRLQAQQRRILALQHEAEALRAEVAAKDGALVEAVGVAQAAQRQVSELQSELEGNAAVFKMHYEEMLLKNEEIARLTAIIEGLGAS